MENVFITNEDKEMYVKGAKNVKDSNGKVVKRKEISGQSYADKYGIDSLKFTVFSAKRAMQSVLEVIDGVDESTQDEMVNILGMLHPVVTKCKELKSTVKAREKVEKVYGDLTDKQFKAIREIVGQ